MKQFMSEERKQEEKASYDTLKVSTTENTVHRLASLALTGSCKNYKFSATRNQTNWISNRTRVSHIIKFGKYWRDIESSKRYERCTGIIQLPLYISLSIQASQKTPVAQGSVSWWGLLSWERSELSAHSTDPGFRVELGKPLPQGSESPTVTAAALASYERGPWFMGLVRRQAYSLQSYQIVIPLANRKVRHQGLGLALSVYGLFLLINLQEEGRVIAGCWGAEWWSGKEKRGRVCTKLGKAKAESAPSRSFWFCSQNKRIFSSPECVCHQRNKFHQVLTKVMLLFLFPF